MKNVKEKKIEFEEDLQFMSLIEQIHQESNKNGINLFQKLEKDESELEITFNEDGTINRIRLDDNPLELSGESRNLSLDLRLEPVTTWVLVSTTTVVVCYLGYQCYKVIKKYIDKKTNKIKEIEKITKKTDKKCGNH
ncbi:MAG: hypothetical protein JXR65_08840 [Bacteroidales bacterium]|nr:hypothetical protein [Bacteroidales bacterium]